MRPLVWLICCLTVVSAKQAPLTNPYNYLALPNEQQLAQSDDAKNIIEALEKLQVEQEEPAQTTMTKINKMLESSADLNAKTRPVFERLALLSWPTKYCPDKLTEQTKLIVAMVRLNLSPAIRFKRFLHRFAGPKFNLCALTHQDSFEALLGLRVEESLDEFFLAASRGGEKLDHLGKCQLFRTLDLTRSRLNLERMARRAADYEPETGQSLSLAMNFLDYKCGQLDQMLGSILDQLNLARLFGADETPFRKRLLKINEHRRLCLSATRSREARLEVEQNLGGRKRSSSSGGLLGKLSCKTAIDCL